MRRAAALIRERAESIAAIMVQEQGKPLAEAKVETMSAAEIIEWFADESQRVYGRIVPSRNLKAQQLVIKDPVGPVAAFTPWNFPSTRSCASSPLPWPQAAPSWSRRLKKPLPAPPS